MQVRAMLHLAMFITVALLLLPMWAHPAHGLSWNGSPESFKTPEYYNGGGLDVINAAEAYFLGYTGKGITLGMVDYPIRTDHPELAGMVWNVPAFLPSGELYHPDWKKDDHGTHVGGIMVARKDGVGMHGVAFNAAVRSVNLEFPFDGDIWTHEKIEEQLSMRPDIRIINNSWRPYIFISGIEMGIAENRADSMALSMSDATLSQMVRFARNNQDTVIVFGAGNESYHSPAVSGLVPRYLGAEVRNWISVTGLNPWNFSRDQNGNLTLTHGALYFNSNLSLGAELWSVMAPAESINSSYSADLGYVRFSGTSMAAPHVSGSLGLVAQAFPWMSGKQLADAVLTTANSNFSPPKFLFQILDGWPVFIKIGDAYGVWDLSIPDAIELLREAYGHSLDDLIPLIEQKQFYTAIMTHEQVFGQGILDAGKAVRGIARLDANRMVKEDVYDLRGTLGGTAKVALETFDTKGHVGEFSNDITERKWDDKYHHPDFQTTATGDTADNAHALALQDLAVGLRKTGAGLLILSGTNSYTGPTVVDGGTLAVSRRWDGSGGVLLNSDVLVDERGLLTGDGEIKGTVINKGTVSPGAMGSILTVGNYTHNVGAMLNIAFDATGRHTALSTTAATLNGGTLQLRPAVGFYADTQFRMGTLVSGAVTGAFDKVNLLSLSPTLSFSLVSGSPAGAVVEQRRAPYAYSQYAISGHAARVGHVLRGIADVAEGDMQNLLTALDFSAPDGSAVRAALPQLTATPYALTTQASAEANLGIGRMALARLRSASGTVAGANADEQHAATKTSSLASGDIASQWSAFVMPFGGGSVQQQYAGAPGYSSSQVGLMGGVFNQNNSLSTSLYTAFSRRRVDIRTSAGAQARSDALHVGTVTLWSQDSHGAGSGWQAWAQAQVGVENTNMRRSVAFEDYARQNSSSSTSFNGVALLGGGYLWRAGELSFGPRVSLEYALNALPAIREDDGGGSRLGMDAHTRHDLRGAAGLMAAWSKDMGEGRSLRVNAEAVWRRDLLPEQREIRTHFAGYSSHAFDTAVTREGHGSLGLMGGVEVSLRQDITLNAQVEANVFRSGYSNVGGSLSLRWEF